MIEPNDEEHEPLEDKALDFYPTKQEIEADLREHGVPEGSGIGAFA